MGSLLGTRVNRREDQELVTGSGPYTGDVPLDGCLVAHFVRSLFAHAVVEAIDTCTAAEMPGVVAVHTFATLGLGPIAMRMTVDDAFRRLPLTHDRVRFVGEPVACVIAETKAQAVDAAAEVVVQYEPLPVSMDPVAALTSSPLLYPERGSDVEWHVGPPVPDLHEDADVIVSARLHNTRMAVSPIEPYSIAVRPDGDTLTVWYSAQGAHAIRDGLAQSLGMPSENVRVIVPWVGGGFGAKGIWQPEHVTVARAAQLAGRPVRWVEDRSENLLSMHGRHQVQFARLGAKHDGRLTSLEVFVVSDAGGYVVAGGFLPMATRLMAQGCYRIPRVKFDHAVVCTNKSPLLAFRGAGRPQATALIERMIDLVARRLDLDPLEIRCANFFTPEEFPVTTATGATYDTGNYQRTLVVAAEAIGYAELRAEQASRRARDANVLLGIGVSSYVEITGGFSPVEYGSAEMDDDGTAIIKVGTLSHGQGHETTFCMLAADRMHLPMSRIRFVQGDTAEVPRGAGTGGSRSAQIGGSAVSMACDRLVEQARVLAAELLEADPADVVFDDKGRFGVVGVPSRSLGWDDLARASQRAAARDYGDDPLFAFADFDQQGATYPFGTHISVVEVDRETGRVSLIRHVGVDDVGNILSPVIVEGQQHGGIAAGVSQALWEHVVYAEDGTPLATSFAEYGIPSAAEFPLFEVSTTQTPTHMNPLGVKGVGEAGTIAATPAVQNAVVDALAHLGVEHIDMPLNAEKVWRALNGADGSDASFEVAWPELPQQ